MAEWDSQYTVICSHYFLVVARHCHMTSIHFVVEGGPCAVDTAVAAFQLEQSLEVVEVLLEVVAVANSDKCFDY